MERNRPERRIFANKEMGKKESQENAPNVSQYQDEQAWPKITIVSDLVRSSLFFLFFFVFLGLNTRSY